MEPEIAPLAKRLAEENNVNWRALSGSGANGRILERDVLEYLARVMAGEEDLNPTAEPLPEGLDAWPEDDVKSYYGVDTSAETPEFAADIDDSSLFVDSMESVATTEPLGEDIFLVDEGDLSAPQVSQEPVIYDSSSDNLDDVYGALTLDDMGVDDAVGSDVFESSLDSFEEPSSEVVETFAESQDFSDTEALFADEVEPVHDAFEALVASEQDNLEDLPAIEASVEPVEELPDETIYASYETVDEPVEDMFAEVITKDAPEVWAETQIASDIIEVETPQVWSESQAFNDVEDTTPVAQAETSSWSAPEESYQEPVVEAPVQAWSESAPVWSEPAEQEQAVAQEQTWAEPESQEPSWSEPVPSPVERIAPVATLAAGAALGAVQSSGENLSALPLVSYGILLRRHVDLSTLIQAQHAVAEELGREDPQALTCFLLRAAAKALHKVPLVQGSVGLASIREHGVGIIEIAEASSAPFRSILNKTNQALGSSQRDMVALAVADMSGFDIDEAVLNVGVPVLTLGRIMYDNSKGAHQSTLSISGNVSVESGTKFLSAVAELLNSPVRLVV